jgi:surface antigen
VRVGTRIALLVLLAALVGGTAGTASSVTVRGYPYAARCPKAGYGDKVDRWGMFMCNCTSYVAWALHANGQRTDWFIPGAMNAWNWPHVARLRHLRVGRKPRVRSVAVWPNLALPFGHVAYVTRVDADGGIDVSEYNLPETGTEPFTYDERKDVQPDGAQFIYVPARR